jgi:uncharacterized cupin superfamily protein
VPAPRNSAPPSSSCRSAARWADLHYHYAQEELLVVLEGIPRLYTLEGSRELAHGDVVAFLPGRRGAHRITNESQRCARVLFVSTMEWPEVVEYPERDEVYVRTERSWTDARYDERRGRLLRIFARRDGRPVPPDD